jgi:hypothetical protein
MLFKNVADLQKYGQVYKTLWDGSSNLIANEIDDATEDVLIDAIGREQYNALDAAYAASPGTPLPAKYVAILPMAQRIVAEIATALYVEKKGLVNIGAHGATQPGDEKTRASSQWAVRATALEYKRAGYRVVDRLLAYMEGDKANYPLWTASTSYTVYKEVFVYNSDMLTKHIALIKNSRRVYKVLVPFLRTSEDMVRNTIGVALFEELKTQLLSGTYTSLNKKLIAYIEPCCSYLAYGFGLKHMAIAIDEFGVTTYDSTGRQENIDTKKTAEMNNLAIIEENAIGEGKRLLADLNDYLIKNYADYPLFTVPIIGKQMVNKITDKVYRM